MKCVDKNVMVSMLRVHHNEDINAGFDYQVCGEILKTFYNINESKDGGLIWDEFIIQCQAWCGQLYFLKMYG